MSRSVAIGRDFLDNTLEGRILIGIGDRKSTRLNSSHLVISYAVFCLKKKKAIAQLPRPTLRACHRRVLLRLPPALGAPRPPAGADLILRLRLPRLVFRLDGVAPSLIRP